MVTRTCGNKDMIAFSGTDSTEPWVDKVTGGVEPNL